MATQSQNKNISRISILKEIAKITGVKRLFGDKSFEELEKLLDHLHTINLWVAHHDFTIEDKYKLYNILCEDDENYCIIAFQEQKFRYVKLLQLFSKDYRNVRKRLYKLLNYSQEKIMELELDRLSIRWE